MAYLSAQFLAHKNAKDTHRLAPPTATPLPAPPPSPPSPPTLVGQKREADTADTEWGIRIVEGQKHSICHGTGSQA